MDTNSMPLIGLFLGLVGIIACSIAWQLGKKRGVSEFCHDYFGAVEVGVGANGTTLHYVSRPTAIEPLPVFGVSITYSQSTVDLVPHNYLANAQNLADCVISNNKKIMV